MITEFDPNERGVLNPSALCVAGRRYSERSTTRTPRVPLWEPKLAHKNYIVSARIATSPAGVPEPLCIADASVA